MCLQATPARADEIWNYVVLNYHEHSTSRGAWTSDNTSAQISHSSMAFVISAFLTAICLWRNTPITSVCVYNLLRLKQVRRTIGLNITARLVSSSVLSRLDYCDIAIPSWPAYLRVDDRSPAAKLIMSLGSCDHTSDQLSSFARRPPSRLYCRSCDTDIRSTVTSCRPSITCSVRGLSRSLGQFTTTHHRDNRHWEFENKS